MFHPPLHGLFLLLAVGALLTSAATADAGPVRASIDDGVIRASVKLPVDVDAVLALLEDPTIGVRLSDSVRSIDLIEQGECASIRVTTVGITRPLLYTATRCRQPDGWIERLAESDDYERNEVSWSVTPTPGGVEVVVLVDSSVKLVPDIIVRRAVLASTKDTLRALKRELLGRDQGE
jgi:hypothetical protein